MKQLLALVTLLKCYRGYVWSAVAQDRSLSAASRMALFDPDKPRIEPFLTAPTQAAYWQPHYSTAGTMVHSNNSMS
jgi:hypothetical protein